MCEPDGTFFHRFPDPENEDDRAGGDVEKDAPTVSAMACDERRNELVNNRREHEAPVEAAHEHSRSGAAQIFRPVFKREGETRGPHAAHADAEERTEGEEHCVAGGKSTEQAEERNPNDAKHQRSFAAEAIGGGAGAESTDQAEHERDGAKRAGE